ncbi:hypothetical protein IPA_06690 [Ignicoccus pacificus DSM 13166]|uniref:Cytochrome b561 bacterial/Ni-hydrogenase domain-containing protein n=1 Tax=Ignicoccus pacificus DSM 13166 TaxID=940294 RepID=A0A977KBL8_9CREN|nr:hypothetical protein IPA_06690 [Ignicoccus pacificus DSM 13166]
MEVLKVSRVRVFSEVQIWAHKHLIHVVGLLLFTGLPFFSKDLFGWVAYVLGYPVALFIGGNVNSLGLEVARWLHRLAAIVLIAISAVVFFAEVPRAKKWRIWPKNVGREVRKLLDYYVHKKRVPFDKYNIGQIAWTWFVIIGIAVMIVTGLIMWFKPSMELVTVAHELHALGAALFMIGLVIHIYAAIGIPEHRPMVTAMFRTGDLPEEYLKEHHPLYYEVVRSERK